MFDIIIVGGGASGMMAAITAARRGASVCILERKERLGKKILATGNGKCNYTNRVQDISCYRGSEEIFIKAVLAKSFCRKRARGVLPSPRCPQRTA